MRHPPLPHAGAAAGPPVPPPAVIRLPSGARLDFSRPRLLGILNLTPDSFSDGGLFLDPEAALRQARRMVWEGAAALDLGAESTRPGAAPVPARLQQARLLPVLRRLRRERDLARVPVSIDTRTAEVFRACLGEGADILNDVSALRQDRRLARIAARAGSPVILMHMRGTPRTMQRDPRYEDVAGAVIRFLRERLGVALAAGLAAEKVWLDPGIGFGKTVEQNCELLARLAELAALGRPLVVGLSRKSFLGRLTGIAEPARRVAASVAAGLWAVQRGARMLRVHDVRPHAEALRVWDGLRGAGPEPEQRARGKEGFVSE